MWFILLLFFLSGATGLIYEVIWTRLLSQTFGNTVFAVSSVLAVFMAGLGSGAFYWGNRIDRGGNGLRLYGLLEVGIGLYAMIVPWIVQLTDPLVSGGLFHLREQFWLQNILRAAVAALYLFLPTFLMGGTLPALARFLTRHAEAVGRDVGGLYAVNTAGAVVGTFLTGFVLIEMFGLLTTSLLAGTVNLAIGGLALWAAGKPYPAGPEREHPAKQQASEADLARQQPLFVRLLLLAYALSGFAALGAEVVWSRALVFFLGNSTYAFSSVLVTFLAGLALGSYVGSRYADRLANPTRAFAVLELMISLYLLGSIFLIWQGFQSESFREGLQSPTTPWLIYLALKFLSAGAVMLVPAFLFGAAFPLVCRAVIRHLPTIGHTLGRIYAWNTLGAIAGSLTVGFILIPVMGLQMSMVVLSLVVFLVGGLLWWMATEGALIHRALPLAGTVVFAWLVTALFPLRTHLAGSGAQAAQELFYQEDHTATVRVYQTASGDKFVSVDGHYIGATEHESDKKQKLLAHLPLMMLPSPQTAITVGLGSGITLGAMSRYASLNRLEAVEIVPGIIQAASFFAAENGDVLNDSRVRVYVDDGLYLIKSTDRRYDAIISDAKLNPEYVGNALVYTREYYAWSRDHLTERGIFCQWVPLYLPSDILKMVFRTFLEAFPVVDLWFFPQQHVILMGRKENYPFDYQTMRTHLLQPRILEHLQTFGYEQPYLLASSRVAGRRALAAFAGDGPLNTYQHPLLEFLSVRAFRRAPRSKVQAENLRTLLRMYGESFEGFSGFDSDSLRFFRRSFRLVLQGMIRAAETDMLVEGAPFFEQALALNPHEGRAKDLLNQAQVESRVLEQWSSAPAGGVNRLKQARLYYQQGNLIRALEALKAHLAETPRSIDGWNLLGLVYQKLNREAQALDAFQKARALDPANAEVLLNLGIVYEKQGQYEQALRYLQQAIELEPGSAKIYNNLGIVLARQHKYEQAREAYEKALALDPSLVEAWNNLGILYGQRQQLTRAVEAFEKVLTLIPNHQAALKNAGITYIQMERFARAIELLTAAAEQTPNDVDIWVNLGLAYARTGRFTEARQCWEKSLQLDPTAAEARRNLQILQKMGY